MTDVRKIRLTASANLCVLHDAEKLVREVQETMGRQCTGVQILLDVDEPVQPAVNTVRYTVSKYTNKVVRTTIR